MKNLIILLAATMTILGIILLFASIQIPAFKEPDKANALFMMSWGDFQNLGLEGERLTVWNDRIEQYRTNKFVLFDCGLTLLFLGICFGLFSLTIKKVPTVPSSKWVVIFLGFLGYYIILYEFIYILDNDFVRYPAPFFMDAQVKAFAGVFSPLLLFGLFVPIIGYVLLPKKPLGSNLFIKPSKEFLFFSLLLLLFTGLVISLASGPAPFSLTGFLIWIWVVLCTRSAWLSDKNNQSAKDNL